MLLLVTDKRRGKGDGKLEGSERERKAGVWKVGILYFRNMTGKGRETADMMEKGKVDIE